MEKNKIKFIFLLIIILFLLGFTIYKIIKTHEDKLYKSFYGKIEYAAKLCFLEEKCKETITLKDLYNHNFLEIQYDPVTKEILNEDLKIEYIDDKVIIHK